MRECASCTKENHAKRTICQKLVAQQKYATLDVSTYQHHPSSLTYNDSSQCGLGVWSYCIGLVKNNDFKRWIGILVCFLFLLFSIHLHFIIICCFGLLEKALFGSCCCWFSSHRQASEVLYFVTYHGNSTFITSIQLQDTTTPLRGMPKLTTKCQCHRCLRLLFLDGFLVKQEKQ